MKSGVRLLANSLLAINMAFCGAAFGKQKPMAEPCSMAVTSMTNNTSARTITSATSSPRQSKKGRKTSYPPISLPPVGQRDSLIRSRISSHVVDSLMVHLKGKRLIFECVTHNADLARDVGTDLIVQLKDSLNIGGVGMEEFSPVDQSKLNALAPGAILPEVLANSTVSWAGGRLTPYSLLYRVDQLVRSGLPIFAIHTPVDTTDAQFYQLDHYIARTDSAMLVIACKFLDAHPRQTFWMNVGASHVPLLQAMADAKGISNASFQILESSMSVPELLADLPTPCFLTLQQWATREKAYDSLLATYAHQVDPAQQTVFYLNNAHDSASVSPFSPFTTNIVYAHQKPKRLSDYRHTSIRFSEDVADARP